MMIGKRVFLILFVIHQSYAKPTAFHNQDCIPCNTGGAVSGGGGSSSSYKYSSSSYTSSGGSQVPLEIASLSSGGSQVPLEIASLSSGGSQIPLDIGSSSSGNLQKTIEELQKSQRLHFANNQKLNAANTVSQQGSVSIVKEGSNLQQSQYGNGQTATGTYSTGGGRQKEIELLEGGGGQNKIEISGRGDVPIRVPAPTEQSGGGHSITKSESTFVYKTIPKSITTTHVQIPVHGSEIIVPAEKLGQQQQTPSGSSSHSSTFSKSTRVYSQVPSSSKVSTYYIEQVPLSAQQHGSVPITSDSSSFSKTQSSQVHYNSNVLNSDNDKPIHPFGQTVTPTEYGNSQAILNSGDSSSFSKTQTSSSQASHYNPINTDKPAHPIIIEQKPLLPAEYGQVPVSLIGGDSSVSSFKTSSSSSSRVYSNAGNVVSGGADKLISPIEPSHLTPIAPDDGSKPFSSSIRRIYHVGYIPTEDETPIKTEGSNSLTKVTSSRVSSGNSGYVLPSSSNSGKSVEQIGQSSLTDYGNIPITSNTGGSSSISKSSSSHLYSTSGYVSPSNGDDRSTAYGQIPLEHANLNLPQTSSDNLPASKSSSTRIHYNSGGSSSNAYTADGQTKPEKVLYADIPYDQNPQVKQYIQDTIENLSRKYRTNQGGVYGGSESGDYQSVSDSRISNSGGLHEEVAATGAKGIAVSTVVNDDIKALIEAQLNQQQIPSVENIMQYLRYKYGSGSSSSYSYSSSSGNIAGQTSLGGAHGNVPPNAPLLLPSSSSVTLFDGQPKTNTYAVSSYFSKSSQTINGKTTESKKGGVTVNDNGVIKQYEYS